MLRISAARAVSREKAHLAHGVDHRPRIVGGDVHVLDQGGEEFGLGVRNGSVHRFRFPLKGERPSER